MNKIDTVSELVLRSKNIIVFTGAGISTESGIADFRSPGGLWERFDPGEFTYQKFLVSEKSREKFWEFSRSLWPVILKAEPNRGHRAIAEFYRMGKLDGVITQNIDGLHQKSGIPDEKVIELHGTARWVICLECGQRYPRDEIQARLESGDRVPRCDCTGIMKSATVSFGQPMPEKKVSEAKMKSAESDFFLVAGSSLEVYPAARMPLIARKNGAKLVIVNLMPTPHDRHADVVINEKAGEVLPRIVAQVKAKLN